MSEHAEDLCEYYPAPDEDHGGVCWGGSELGSTPCTEEYSLTCPYGPFKDRG